MSTNFETKQGENESIEVYKKGHGSITSQMICFISTEGHVFFDTEGEQVFLSITLLRELIFTIEQAAQEQDRKKYAGIK